MPSRRVQKKKAAPAPAAEPQEEAPPLRVCEIELPGNELPFRQWLFGLRDAAARARVLIRIERILTGGNFGDHRERIQGAVNELRIDYGAGYRLYYVRQGETIVVLIGGGTKAGQQGDIATAIKLWERVKNDVERHTRDFAP